MLSYFLKPKKEEKQQARATASPPRPLSPLDNTHFDPANCTVTPLPDYVTNWIAKDQFAIVIDNVLSPDECRQWIADTETGNYELALVNVGGGRQKVMTDIRNSSRVIIDDEIRAAELWERVKHFVPIDIRTGQNFVPRELNERLRFLRYDPGEFFAPHCDGCYSHPVGHSKYMDVSWITLQLYLNEGFEGGATRFFGDWDERKKAFDVVPKMGSVLLFEHRLYHSGEVVTSGRKYAMRTDIMFTPVSRQMIELSQNGKSETETVTQYEED